MDLISLKNIQSLNMDLISLKDIQSTLLSCDISTINTFSLNNIDTLCRCIRIIDGDTFEGIISLPGFGLQKIIIRLADIDTPELHSKDDHESQIAIKSKNRLSSLILDKIVYIKIKNNCLYGRYLCDVYNLIDDTKHDFNINNISISDILINEHLATPYTNPHVARTPFHKLKKWYGVT